MVHLMTSKVFSWLKKIHQKNFAKKSDGLLANAVEEWVEENYTDALINKMPYMEMKADDDHYMVRTKVFTDKEMVQ